VSHITAKITKNGNELVLKIAPPASEYVVVRARRVGSPRSGGTDATRESLNAELAEAQKTFADAIENGSPEEIISRAKARLEELKRRQKELDQGTKLE
jgi:hypothetical protein